MKENQSIQKRGGRENEMSTQLTETKGGLGNGFGEVGKLTEKKVGEQGEGEEKKRVQKRTNIY